MATNLNTGAAGVDILLTPNANLSTRGYSLNDQTQIIGCNQPLLYKVKWGETLSRITNQSLASSLQVGDLVNVLFDVYIGVDYDAKDVNNTTGATDMVLIGTLRKSRDIPYKRGEGIKPRWTQGNNQNQYHTFTVDIAPLVKSYLSYTLVPLMKGSMTHIWAMGGHYSTDDVTPFTSSQGSLRFVDVQMRFEVKESTEGINLVVANNGTNDVRKNTLGYAVINSVPQPYGDGASQGNLNLWRITTDAYSSATNRRGKFFSLCPNANNSALDVPPYDSPKLVRMDEEGEWLSFYLERFIFTGSGASRVIAASDFYMRVTAKDAAGGTVDYINLRDYRCTIGSCSGTSLSGYDVFVGKYIMQNVAPAYLVSKGLSITSAVTHLEAVLYVNPIAGGVATYTCSETRNFVIDRETENTAFPFVRFHWVNRMGGIDSYTAKGDITEGMDVTKTFFERKTTDMRYIQQYTGTTYTTYQDPLGADIYKPSIDTLGMTGTKKGSVFTEPLNTPQAKWLEEILTSPNVWIELENTQSKRAEDDNSTMHPSTKDYFPVIINNSTVSTVDESLGLVKFNIEYTYSHKINTQSN